MRRFVPILIVALALLLAGFLYARRHRKQVLDAHTVSSQSTHDGSTINENGIKLVENYREILGTQLPPFELAKGSGEKLAENLVREGNVVLFFLASDCRACIQNGQFFKSTASRRSDVRYYGVRPFDKESESDEVYVKSVPFAVYFDVDHKLTRYLGIRGVPVVVFLKDGNIRKIWGGIATREQDKVAFSSWISSL